MPRQTIQEYLGVPASWKVKENIKHAIVLMPSKMDIRRGKKMDPQACALHNAACRTYDLPNCAIGGQTALIPQKDEKGKWYIARVKATAATQRAIRHFDETGKIPEGGFVFAALPKAHRLKPMRKYAADYYKGDVGSKDKPRKTKKGRRLLTARRSIPTSLAF